MIGTKLYKGEFTNKEYADESVWADENNAYISDEGEYYETKEKPEPTREQKERDVREVRSYYFDKYVDWYQSKPLLWEELSEEEKQYRGEYREYLKDYTKEENWWEQNPMTYEEWLVAHHPVEE